MLRDLCQHGPSAVHTSWGMFSPIPRILSGLRSIILGAAAGLLCWLAVACLASCAAADQNLHHQIAKDHRHLLRHFLWELNGKTMMVLNQQFLKLKLFPTKPTQSREISSSSSRPHISTSSSRPHLTSARYASISSKPHLTSKIKVRLSAM